MLVSRPSAAAFQSTLPRRERPTRTTLRCSSVYFNPRSREGSDLEQLLSGHYAVDFNPRSREGSDLSVSVIHGNHTNFNPRSREGSDLPRILLPGLTVISIHAPAKGATSCPVSRSKVPWHFNPRSREGSDLGYDIDAVLQTDFNPRSREGSDTLYGRQRRYGDISIHAPAKGATH